MTEEIWHGHPRVRNPVPVMWGARLEADPPPSSRAGGLAVCGAWTRGPAYPMPVVCPDTQDTGGVKPNPRLVLVGHGCPA